GRYTCTAHSPQCPNCVMNDLCPKIGVDAPAVKPAPAAEATTAPNKAKAAPAKKEAAAPPPPEPEAPSLHTQLPADWQKVLADEFKKPYFKQLEKFVAGERKAHTVFPPEPDVFNAFKYAPYDKVKVLLLGQDPYHDDGQAHGLCFSV